MFLKHAFLPILTISLMVLYWIFGDSRPPVAKAASDDSFPSRKIPDQGHNPWGSQDGKFVIPSPFGKLECRNAYGEHVRTTQCDGDFTASDQMKPSVLAQHIANDIALGNYGKLPDLNAIFHGCWYHDQGDYLATADKLESACDPKDMADIEQNVENALSYALKSNKPGAVEANKNWLFSAYQLQELIFESTKNRMSNPPNRIEGNEVAAKAGLDAARAKMIEFLGNLPGNEKDAKSLMSLFRAPEQ